MAVHGTFARQPTPDSLRSAANHDPGLFGRMFDAPPLTAGDDALFALAAAMRDSGNAGEPNDKAGDSTIPAGFTYLGQFIDHDVTLDTTSLSEKIEDPDGVENFRTPALDLDSVYGLGPGGSPHLYERDPGSLKIGPKLLLGTAAASPRGIGPDGNPTGFVPGLVDHDLPRNPRTGIAVIGDPRNDDNLVVAQTHVAFMRFHNRVVDLLRGRGVKEAELFASARRMATWHYQWLVLHEFLDTITGQPGIADRIVYQGREY
jgi:Animal haem peroxidase